MFILFLALHADDSRADDGLKDSGNGFIMSDEELSESFPALAQLPLGTANDFAHTLGWGRKFPGDAERSSRIGSKARAAAAHRALTSWFQAVISPTTRLANFDVWGVMPPAGSEIVDFKLAELGGRQGHDPRVVVDGQKQLQFKPARHPVPLFVCLYYSAGFAAYMTARFQLNRRSSPLFNTMEYARQAAGILSEKLPPQLNVGLEGVQVSTSGERYFPPRSADGSGGAKYREVGFLNINWQAGMAHGADRAPFCGRLCATREPAKFNDGKVDMFRLKLRSMLKNPGPRYQTDKRQGPVSMRFEGGRGKGIFLQWDGEARFAMSTTGEAFSIDIRKIVSIPVVIGPGYDARVTGDPDDGREVCFGFVGETPEDRAAVRRRICRCVRGELDAEMNATEEEMHGAGLPCR